MFGKRALPAMSAVTDVEVMKRHEAALQRCVTVWIVTGLLFMLLPGTFLGAWNLISISHQHGARAMDPAWIQAHGHAQIFGWVGAFILGIGYYSLSKMRVAVSRAWTSWILWTTGVGLRWITNLWGWQWRLALPLSAALELSGFFLFFLTVRGHRSQGHPGGGGQGEQAWIGIVVAGTLGFLLSLLANLGTTLYVALTGRGPALPGAIDQHLLPLFTRAFLVVTVWGFSARWLPVFLGLAKPNNRLLRIA